MSCQRCNVTDRESKVARWNAYDAGNRAADAEDHRDLMSLWIKDQLSTFGIRRRLPDVAELRRKFPMTPVSPRPLVPLCEDVR